MNPYRNLFDVIDMAQQACSGQYDFSMKARALRCVALTASDVARGETKTGLSEWATLMCRAAAASSEAASLALTGNADDVAFYNKTIALLNDVFKSLKSCDKN